MLDAVSGCGPGAWPSGLSSGAGSCHDRVGSRTRKALRRQPHRRAAWKNAGAPRPGIPAGRSAIRCIKPGRGLQGVPFGGRISGPRVRCPAEQRHRLPHRLHRHNPFAAQPVVPRHGVRVQRPQPLLALACCGSSLGVDVGIRRGRSPHPRRLDQVSLAAAGNQAGGLPVSPVASPAYSAQVYGPPAGPQPTLAAVPSAALAAGTFPVTTTLGGLTA